jgi:hypothetical protein
MPSDHQQPGSRPGRRKPKAELRHWSTYGSPTEYHEDYRGHVPLPMMVGISQAMREGGLTFVEAYRALLDRGAIVHVNPDEPAEPGRAREG